MWCEVIQRVDSLIRKMPHNLTGISELSTIKPTVIQQYWRQCHHYLLALVLNRIFSLLLCVLNRRSTHSAVAEIIYLKFHVEFYGKRQRAGSRFQLTWKALSIFVGRFFDASGKPALNYHWHVTQFRVGIAQFLHWMNEEVTLTYFMIFFSSGWPWSSWNARC